MIRPILLASATIAAMWLLSLNISATHAADKPITATSTSSASVQPTPTPLPEPTISSYSVQPGEYLDKIAKEHSISWPSIYELNTGISDPDVIYPDQKLELPNRDVPLTRQLPGNTTMQVPDSFQPQVTIKTSSTTKNTAEPIVSGRSGMGIALSLVGLPYRYGGTSVGGFDCSGLTQYVAAQQGVSLPRTVVEQYTATVRIAKGDLQPGDLVFFNTHHVGMYIGNGQIIHAATPALGVRIDSLAAAIAYNGYMGAGRW
jgi:cell wall-associated NlpC family hydrolase